MNKTTLTFTITDDKMKRDIQDYLSYFKKTASKKEMGVLLKEIKRMLKKWEDFESPRTFYECAMQMVAEKFITPRNHEKKEIELILEHRLEDCYHLMVHLDTHLTSLKVLRERIKNEKRI